MQKEAVEAEEVQQRTKQQFNEQCRRSLIMFYRKHDRDMVEGVDEMVEMLANERDSWDTLCENLQEEFAEGPTPLEEVDAAWEVEEAERSIESELTATDSDDDEAINRIAAAAREEKERIRMSAADQESRLFALV